MNYKPISLFIVLMVLVATVSADNFIIKKTNSEKIGVEQKLNVMFQVDDSDSPVNRSNTKVNYIADSKKGVSIGLSINFELEECTQNRLMQRKLTDESNYENIVKATENVEQSKQNLFVNEALSMDKEFINEFTAQDYPMSIQVYPYLNSITNPTKVYYEESKLTDLFSKKISIKKFIDDIWN